MAKERILIVEDEKLIRWSIRERLAEEGYEVREAENGKEAFALLEEEDFDLLALDYRLPDITGQQILEHGPGGIVPLLLHLFQGNLIRLFGSRNLILALEPPPASRRCDHNHREEQAGQEAAGAMPCSTQPSNP